MHTSNIRFLRPLSGFLVLFQLEAHVKGEAQWVTHWRTCNIARRRNYLAICYFSLTVSSSTRIVLKNYYIHRLFNSVSLRKGGREYELCETENEFQTELIFKIVEFSFDGCLTLRWKLNQELNLAILKIQYSRFILDLIIRSILSILSFPSCSFSNQNFG